MASDVSGWVDPVMRAGYAGRGLVYVIVGGLAAAAAVWGGSAEGTKGALSWLTGQAWGDVLLVVITVGLFAYAIWRAVDAAMDLEDEGTGAKGLVARTGMVVSGIIHLFLGLYAFSLVFASYDGPGSASGGGGGSSGGAGGGTEGMTATLMAQPFGRWLVGIVGAVVIGAGIYFWVKGFKEKYKEDLRVSPTTERLDPFLKFGLFAHGVVVVLIGAFFVYAAWTHDPSEAGGINQAFSAIRGSPGGRIALGIVGLGLVAFAVYLFVEARYRVIPRRAGPDVQTLAGKAKSAAHRAEGAARRAAG